jgi:hypothetical protein
MLGRFLELALVVDDPGAAWLRYQQLGFVTAETGDVFRHAYGVVACRNFALGLHGRGDESPSIVFVRPDVAALHRDLSKKGLRVETAQLGSDAFNQLTLREPGGLQVRVLEARSFSPPPELPQLTRLGEFGALSLPCRDLPAAAAFWGRLGLGAVPTDDPWEGFVLAGTPIACHARRSFPEAALLFQQSTGLRDGMIADTPLQRETALSSLGDRDHLLLRTGEDLALIVLG